MTSPRRRQGRPIESVVLKVGFRADRRTLLRIKRAVPEARWQKGGLEVRLSGTEPAEVVDETKGLADRVRAAFEGDTGLGKKGGNLQKTLRSAKMSAIRK